MVSQRRCRWLVKTLDVQTRLVPERQADRSGRVGHSLCTQPVLCGLDQRTCGFAFEDLEHAPIADALSYMLLDKLVDLRADAPHNLAAAFRQPEFGPGMLEPWVLSWSDQSVDLILEGRHPGGIILVDLPGKVDEGLLVPLGSDRADGKGAAVHKIGLAAETAHRQ